MATVKLTLERSRALKDGSYPVVFQIIHRRIKRILYTQYRVQEHEFDLEKERIKFISEDVRHMNDVSIINISIRRQRKSIERHIDTLSSRKFEFSVSEVATRFQIECDSLSLIGYFDFQIKRKRELNKFGTVRAYEYTRSSVSKFVNYSPVRISDVNCVFVSKYERYLAASKISINTTCFHFRNFKSIYNQAIVDGYTEPTQHPFKYIQIKPQKTAKRALDKKSMIRIKKLDLAEKSSLELSRDIFLFCFYSRGMAIVDALNLTHKNIRNGVICYNRQKTNQYIEIIITSDIVELINKYRTSSRYVFPCLTETEMTEKHYKDYRASMERINRNLKSIGKMLNLEIPLTTYVARHSWATLAKQAGVSLSLISEGLGHTSEKTTQIYLKAFDRRDLDIANRKATRL